jgi:uncharacterized membrane protein
MFGRNGSSRASISRTAGSVKEAVANGADTAVDYVVLLATDPKLRDRLGAAVSAGTAARQRVRRRTGFPALAQRLAGDPVLRAQLAEMATQLRAAQRRVKKSRSHTLRNTVLSVGGAGVVVAAVPTARGIVRSMLRARGDRSFAGAASGTSTASPTRIEEVIEVAVPLTTAYNQWTQFEDFPRFMEGVDEVRQLDDTLLHWAATVGGKRAEWDAKIVEQEPDRRITWESTDGKQTRGTVSFEHVGEGRTRIRMHMSYTPEGVAEKVGSAVGLDSRRVRGDLERFRDLIEERRVETGAWRGEIANGAEARTDT